MFRFSVVVLQSGILYMRTESEETCRNLFLIDQIVIKSLHVNEVKNYNVLI